MTSIGFHQDKFVQYVSLNKSIHSFMFLLREAGQICPVTLRTGVQNPLIAGPVHDLH
jgi:hypothetical protein